LNFLLIFQLKNLFFYYLDFLENMKLVQQ